jgi:hypothetical protein
MSWKRSLIRCTVAAAAMLAISLPSRGYAAADGAAARDPSASPASAVPEKGAQMSDTSGETWYKGDIHYHHVKQVPVADTIPILQRHGYDFVILEYKDMEPTDIIPAEGSLTRPDFLVIHGSEQAFRSRAEEWAHLSIAPNHIPYPDTETDDWHIPDGFDTIRKRIPNALIRINHPADKRWTLDDIRDAVARGARMFELNPGDEEGIPYAVRLWDEALAAGMLLYASLATDIHHIDQMARWGYVLVRAEKLEQWPILEAMRAGDFVAVDKDCAARVTEVTRGTGKPGSEYRVVASDAAAVRFVGRGGVELASVAPQDGVASYAVRGDEIYVRAEILDTAGRRIYTQPVMVTGR